MTSKIYLSLSIYGFRQTSPEFLIHYDKYMGGKKVVDLPLMENYRSSKEICDFANVLIRKNVNRILKEIIPTRPASGVPVDVQGFYSKDEERKYVIDGVKKLLANGTEPEDIAIICRNAAELQEMAGLLTNNNIPSVLLNPELYISNSRVLAGIALCRAVNDPNATEDLFTYANAMESGALFQKSLSEQQAAIEKVKDLVTEVRAIGNPEEKKKRLMELLQYIDRDDEVYETFITTLGFKSFDKLLDYADKFKIYGSKSSVRRVHNYPGVVLTTAHSSKGLEWNHVFGMISKFDSVGLHSGRDSRDRCEEERRLLFVLSTRARDSLTITAQYVAYGSVRDGYVLNQFLVEAGEIVGKSFDLGTIIAEKQLRAAMEREEAKKKTMAMMSADGKLFTESDVPKKTSGKKLTKATPKKAVAKKATATV